MSHLVTNKYYVIVLKLDASPDDAGTDTTAPSKGGSGSEVRWPRKVLWEGGQVRLCAHVEEKIAGRGRRDLMDGKGNNDEYITVILRWCLPCPACLCHACPPPLPSAPGHSPAGPQSPSQVCASPPAALAVVPPRWVTHWLLRPASAHCRTRCWPLPLRCPLTCPFPCPSHWSRAHGSLPSPAPRVWPRGSWWSHVRLFPTPGTCLFCSGWKGNYQSPCSSQPPSRSRTTQFRRPVSPLLAPSLSLLLCPPILFPAPSKICSGLSFELAA